MNAPSSREIAASPTSIISSIAKVASSVRFEDLPAAVIDESKRLVLDSIGCALAGATSDKGKAALAFSRQFGGLPEATIIGFGDKVSTLGAAFANAELINALDWDAVLVPGHVTPFALPAYLATGERRGATGKSLILANALAHEISHRLGKALRNQRQITDGTIQFPPVMGYSCSVIGGALGVAKVGNFPDELAAHSMAIAAHIAPGQVMTAWVKHAPSSTAKYLLAGWAAQASLTAPLLAELGHRGDLQLLDDEFGFWKYMGSDKWEPRLVTEDFGTHWHFQPEQIYKYYPHCRILHACIDGLIHIVESHNILPHEIESIHALFENHCLEPVWSNRTVDTQVDAQFSMAHGLSVAAHRICPGPEWQDYETILNPSVQALMSRITIGPHPDYVRALQEDHRSRLSRVEVKARGQTFIEERRYPKGSPSPQPDTVMTTDEMADKFRVGAQRILARHKIEPAIDAILELENVKNIADLMDLVRI